MIYDVSDDDTGVYSALRGHSLTRSIYGMNDQGGNYSPFNGTGRLHASSPFPGVDDFSLINYTFFSGDQLPPRSGAARHTQDRRSGEPCGPVASTPAASTCRIPTRTRTTCSWRRPVPATAGCWPRRTTGPSLFGPLDMSNPNWTTREGKYLLLRPRPIDMGPCFPYPEDGGGDVKNLADSPGSLGPNGEFFYNDSFWIDLDYPVLTLPDRRKVKPLFAPLILDLDNRLNVNVHGNIRGTGLTHVSNQGWGPWEVNLGRALTRGTEWTNLLAGQSVEPLRPGRQTGRRRHAGHRHRQAPHLRPGGF